MRLIILFLRAFLEILLVLSYFGFPNLRRPFSVFSQAISSWARCTFVNKEETFIFFSPPDPSRVQKLSANILISLWQGIYLHKFNENLLSLGHKWKHWLYYQGFDCNVLFKGDMHRIRYD